MAQNVLSNLILNFRKKTGLSQAEVAKLLQVTQATVSRLEAGVVAPSEELAEKIKNLSADMISPSQTPAEARTFEELKTIRASDFNLTMVSISLEEKSGDFCSIDKITANKISFILADTVGHGLVASGSAFALEVAYHTLLSTFNENFVQPWMFESALRAAISKTPKRWLGPPSLLAGMLNPESGIVGMTLSGIPKPLFLSKGQLTELSPKERPSDNFAPMSSYRSQTTYQTLAPGDSLLMFTDGFAELIGYLHNQDLKTSFSKVGKLLKGDSEAIIKNILKTGERGFDVDTRRYSDDATALLIARKRVG